VGFVLLCWSDQLPNQEIISKQSQGLKLLYLVNVNPGKEFDKSENKRPFDDCRILCQRRTYVKRFFFTNYLDVTAGVLPSRLRREVWQTAFRPQSEEIN